MSTCDLCKDTYTDWPTHARTWRHRFTLFVARIFYLA